MVDKDYGGLSKEEIARQFMLPERKSKIATLLKQDRQYCICRSSDSSRFMIGCDNCEEWYHGDCIQITEKEAKHIKQYFCIRCREEDSSLRTRFKASKRDSDHVSSSRRSDHHVSSSRRSEQHVSSSYKNDQHLSSHKEERKQKKRSDGDSGDRSQRRMRCGSCMGCYQSEDCGRCELCRDMRKFGGPGRFGGQCLARVCTNVTRRPVHQSSRPPHKRKRKESSSDGEKPFKQEAVRHCFGPNCVRSARPGSKYCSDQCGLALAKNRIYQVLPQRIQEWALSPCVAEENNKRQLDNVRKQLLEVRTILQELDKRHKELDIMMERAQQATVDENYEDDFEDDGESMYCITCGHEVSSRTAIRHMEKCFNKYESQASFGSIYKTRIEGNNMFCDYYNPMTRMYCKRLRVLCPEHCKDAKVGDKEVCGCPLVTNVFDSTGEFCRAPKKNCVRHFCWDKLRRAEIDMERVRQWLKLDELVEQERQLRQKLVSRAGVLALMLHSTYNHDVMEQMQKQQQELQRHQDEEQQRQLMDGNKTEQEDKR